MWTREDIPIQNSLLVGSPTDRQTLTMTLAELLSTNQKEWGGMERVKKGPEYAESSSETRKFQLQQWAYI